MVGSTRQTTAILYPLFPLSWRFQPADMSNVNFDKNSKGAIELDGCFVTHTLKHVFKKDFCFNVQVRGRGGGGGCVRRCPRGVLVVECYPS